jgi:hypothetical protein
LPTQIDAPLESVRKASPETLLDWVSRNGFVGAAPGIAPLDLHALREEGLADIRYAIRQLEGCRRLLAAVRTGESTRRLRLRRKALGRPAWLQDPQHDRTAASELGLAGIIDNPPRRTLPGDFGALIAVADEISFWVERTTSVRLVPRATRTMISSDPEILAKGPLGLAFLDLFDKLSRLPINRGKTGRRLFWYDTPAICPICHREFRRLREDQKFDTKQCRWIANKRHQREREGSV